MLHEIAGKVYKRVRERAGLSIDDVAAAIGKTRSIVYRIESGEQVLKGDLEEKLLKKANLSQAAYFEVICDVLTEMLGRPIGVAPKGLFLPEAPLKRASDLYAKHQSRLDPEVRDKVEAKLHTGRLIDAASDQYASLAEKEVRALIEACIGDDSREDASGRPHP